MANLLELSLFGSLSLKSVGTPQTTILSFADVAAGLQLVDPDDGILNRMPDVVILKILNNLSYNNLLSCRKVNKRFISMISYDMLLNAFSRKYPPAHTEVSYSKAQYNQYIRPWLLSFGRYGSKSVEIVDTLASEKYFNKAIFFAISKTLTNTDPCELRERFTTDFNKCLNVLDVSPNNCSLVTVSGDDNETVQVLGLNTTGKWTLQYQKIYDDVVRVVCFSPDSRTLVTGLQTGRVEIAEFDGQDNWIPMDNYSHPHWVSSAIFSHDSRTLVTCGTGDGYQIRSINGEVKWIQAFTTHAFVFVALNPDRCKLLTVTELSKTQFDVQIWKLEDNMDNPTLKVLFTCGFRVASIQFSSDSQTLILLSVPAEKVLVCRFNASDQLVFQKELDATSLFHPACLSPDGCSLVTKMESYSRPENPHESQATDIIWRINEADQCVKEKEISTTLGSTMLFSPNSHILVITIKDEKHLVYNRHVNGSWKDSFILPASLEITCISRDSRSLAMNEAAGDHSLVMHFNDEGQLVSGTGFRDEEKKGRLQVFGSNSFSRDGNMLVMGSSEGKAQIWCRDQQYGLRLKAKADHSGSVCVHQMPGSQGRGSSPAFFIQDGRFVVVHSVDYGDDDPLDNTSFKVQIFEVSASTT